MLAALTDVTNELAMPGFGISWRSQHLAGTSWFGR